MRAEDRGLEDSPRRDDDRETQGNQAESCEEHVADSPKLARALRLVGRLSEVPISDAEIVAARERVRARVFAAIATRTNGDGDGEGEGDGDGKLLAAHSADLLAPDVVSTTAARRAAAGDRVRRDTRPAGQGEAARRRRGPWGTPWRAIYVAAAALALGSVAGRRVG